MVRADGIAHGVVAGQPVEVKFRVSAGQPQRVAWGQRGIGEGREERQRRAHRAQAIEVGGIEETERRIPRDGDPQPGEIASRGGGLRVR
jgi:hypothetical protein